MRATFVSGQLSTSSSGLLLFRETAHQLQSHPPFSARIQTMVRTRHHFGSGNLGRFGMVRRSTLAATLCLLLIFSMTALAQITNTPVDPNQNPPANQNQYPNQNNQNQYPNQNNQNQYPNQNQQPVFGNNQQMGNLSSGTEIKV